MWWDVISWLMLIVTLLLFAVFTVAIWVGMIWTDAAIRSFGRSRRRS